MDDGHPNGGGAAAATLRQRMRAALTSAMKARDQVRVRTLRSALGALDNAEAVDLAAAPPPGVSSGHIAGGVAGLGAAEVARQALDADRVAEMVRAEVNHRRQAADEYERAGATERARELRDEADVLSSFLDG